MTFPPRRIGTSTCGECGATITYEKIEGRDDPVALEVLPEIATGDNHQDCYRMKSYADRIFEPVTRLGQMGQLAHETRCPARGTGRVN